MIRLNKNWNNNDFTDLDRLKSHYNDYLVQRLTKESPHLTFKKYLAAHNLREFCDLFDSVMGGDISELVYSGTIEYNGNLWNHKNTPDFAY